ncbi:MAG: hypothetical protein HQL54_14005 [Magnetococcales bacterium]|nr:hypothetical protein [Magnetococcales bacterium]
MGQYLEGSVGLVNGSATVTGTGTAWMSKVSVGDLFRVIGVNATYQVGGVTTDSELQLTAPWAGADLTGATYLIHRDFTSPDSIPLLNKGDIESYAILNRALNQIQDRLSELSV